MLSCSLLIKGNNKEITDSITNVENTVKKYADQQDFVNIRPTIGIDGETQLDIMTNGLIATLPEKVIFLGGYCSTLQKADIQLIPNSTNYIYISRDKDDRHKINIDNRNIVIGFEGQTAFDRFMAGKFVTNGTDVTSSIIYKIN